MFVKQAMVGQKAHDFRTCNQRNGRRTEDEQRQDGQTGQATGRNKNHQYIGEIARLTNNKTNEFFYFTID